MRGENTKKIRQSGGVRDRKRNRVKKERESDKPLSYKDEQTDRPRRAQDVAQICAVGGGGRVSCS